MTDGDAVAPLSVATDLELTVDGVPVGVRSTGDRLFLEVPTLRTAVRMARDGEGLEERLAPVLRVTDLTVEVRVREATVAVLGADARPGWLSRELDVDPVEVRVGGALAAVGRTVLAGTRRVARLLPV
ncbi:peptide ABC transporter ATP-binding protein [Halobaculum sp. MBLA0147]|uniref:peptide ABC transporter ATP-binding protein n=1 Tax=Halobaculum sp. MBLA0147 TaxID=3079934 RepID=UPI003523C2EF